LGIPGNADGALCFKGIGRLPSLDTDVDRRTKSALQQYRDGKWRAPLFSELVIGDIRSVGGKASVLDIGCGSGFDGSEKLQRAISQESGYFYGVESDAEITPPRCFTEVYSCSFEEAPLAESSFDVAYAVFVLEHVRRPDVFWRKLAYALKPGGVFWGFTVDRRHYFAWASTLLKWTRLKDAYLGLLHGADHYENYPTYYKCNTPHAIKNYAREFSQIQYWSWNRLGQLDAYVPHSARFASRSLDRLEIACGLPGSLLLVRAVR
jgi:SAM-dependent methyltransferase